MYNKTKKKDTKEVKMFTYEFVDVELKGGLKAGKIV